MGASFDADSDRRSEPEGGRHRELHTNKRRGARGRMSTAGARIWTMKTANNVVMGAVSMTG
jgi:hypothetical protein